MNENDKPQQSITEMQPNLALVPPPDAAQPAPTPAPSAQINSSALKLRQLTINLHPDSVAELDALARFEIRTRAAMCAILIREALAHRKNPTTSAPTPKGKKGKK